MELAGPIAEILARIKGVLATAAPFDPATSTRRFTLGAPDAVLAVLLSPLLARLRTAAPGINISLRQLLPVPGEMSPGRAWRGTFDDLESRVMDITVIPSDEIPARFESRTLYAEKFVIAMRPGHAFARDPSLVRYCAMQHLVVSLTGDPFGFVDQALTERGLSRRVALTVPNFMFALAVLDETDLIAALPERFLAMHANRFKLIRVPPPLPLAQFQLNAVASKAAMLDAGLAWLFNQISWTEPVAT
jgi:DNA-binding transcriptional LysR family regulator